VDDGHKLALPIILAAVSAGKGKVVGAFAQGLDMEFLADNDQLR